MKRWFIQFFTSFLNKVISKSLKSRSFLSDFCELICWQLYILIPETKNLQEQFPFKFINISRFHDLIFTESMFICRFLAQILTLDQVVGWSASGS